MGLPIIGIALAVLSLLAISQIYTMYKTAYCTELRHIPGPQHARWTRLGLKFRIMGGTRTQYIHSLHKKYGSFVRIAPNEVSVVDLDAFRAIHRIGSGFNKAPWYTTFVDSALGLFSMTDPKEHAQRRRLFAQSFSNANVLNSESIVRGRVDLAIEKIKRDAKATNGDILKWFTYMATDVIGQLSFGKSFEMLEQEQKNQYVVDLETTMMIAGMRSEAGPLLSIASILPIPALRNALQINARLLAYGRQAIQNQKTFATSKNHASVTTLFERCLDTGKNQALSDTQIAQEGSNFIVAGSDTTGVSLTYIMYNILRPENRAIRQKLLDEIKDVPADASATELSSLVYLRAVIDEGLRLFGAAPGSLPRTVPQGGAKLGEYFLPQGTVAATQAFTMHRDPAVFPDPERFYPDRWLNTTQDMKDAFNPFGAGTRVCIGIHIAMLELILVTFRFFKECPTAELSPSTTPESMEIENFFLIAPKSHRCEIRL